MKATWWSCGSGYVEIRITRQDAESCNHSGPCDSDVLTLSRKPYIRKQIATLNPQAIVKCLREYGAWDDVALQDIEQNVQRLLWIAACDIAEGQS